MKRIFVLSVPHLPKTNMSVVFTFTSFEVLTSLLLKNQILWDMTPFRLVNNCWYFEGSDHPLSRSFRLLVLGHDSEATAFVAVYQSTRRNFSDKSELLYSLSILFTKKKKCEKKAELRTNGLHVRAKKKLVN
jgi:hypothetical protein